MSSRTTRTIVTTSECRPDPAEADDDQRETRVPNTPMTTETATSTPNATDQGDQPGASTRDIRAGQQRGARDGERSGERAGAERPRQCLRAERDGCRVGRSYRDSDSNTDLEPGQRP